VDLNSRHKSRWLVQISILLVLAGCVDGGIELEKQSTPPTARFDISFSDVPPAAETAFRHAASVWAEHLSSPVTIRIRVTWIPDGPRGFALHNLVWNSDRFEHHDIWYPSALADALAGEDLQPGEDDINLFFREDNRWFFDTDGAPMETQLDFMTIALHEIAHGLGISSMSCVPEEGEREATFADPMQYKAGFELSFALPDLGETPELYDRFIADEDGRSITDSNLYPSRSAELYQVLSTHTLTFRGEHAQKANGGNWPPVAAQSITHLASSSFGRDDADYLMTPSSGDGIASRRPGPVVLGMLRDLGWTLRTPN